MAGETSAVEFNVKCLTKFGESLVVVGDSNATGSWNPQLSSIQLETGAETYPTWSAAAQLPQGSTLSFKFVIVAAGLEPRWEQRIPNRMLKVPGCAASIQACFDEPGEELEVKEPQSSHAAILSEGYSTAGEVPASPKPAESTKVEEVRAVVPVAATDLPPLTKGLSCDAITADFVASLAKEDASVGSYRQKLEVAQKLLKDGTVANSQQLACLQAYLNFVASGQIKCREDGGHHRPNHAANASRSIMDSLRELAKLGDAEQFIVRRIVPSLPSFASGFTCAVPMTRIRDIAHRNDIPQELKTEIKTTLQNKLHRCADPGDLVTCTNIVQRIRKEPHNYSASFVEQLELFYVELKEFFNASNLDDAIEKIAMNDKDTSTSSKRFLDLKRSSSKMSFKNFYDQLAALTELRTAIKPKSDSSQEWLLLDIELEKYSFVLLSNLIASFETAPSQEQFLIVLQLALRQLELSALCPEESAIVGKELAAAGKPKQERAWFLRVLASGERALRICFQLQRQLAIAYAGTMALAGSLPIERRAVDVLLEAELRASVPFQVSKLAQMVVQMAKAVLNIPNWVAICSGTAVGRLLRVGALEDLWKKPLPNEGVVAFCDTASGEEEVPAGCNGVVVGRDLPVLSHLAVRARQMGVTFACTSEDDLFHEHVKLADSTPIRLTVRSNGDVEVMEVGSDALSINAPIAGSSSPPPAKLGSLNLAETSVLSVAEVKRALPETVGAKASSAGRLEALAAQKVKDGVFFTPASCAIPFGVMSNTVNCAAFKVALAALETALIKNECVNELAEDLRKVVASLRVPPAVLKAVAAAFPATVNEIAVRSSANSEDLENVSGAGLHDSVLGVAVSRKDDLERAILQVWGSLFTLRAVQSRHAAGMPLYKGISMGVLVQEMATSALKSESTFAFIMFSENVSANDQDQVYIEMCVGLGETLASANMPGTPYRMSVQKKQPHAVDIISLGSFSHAMHVSNDKDKLVEHTLIDYSSVKLSTDFAFLETLARRLATVALRVEAFYGAGMDMEGVVIDSATKQSIFLVQARPIVKAKAL